MTAVEPELRLLSGIYIGHVPVASATAAIDGHTVAAHVVTLAGNPGWSELYYLRPAASAGHDSITVTAYNADGHVLAAETATEPWKQGHTGG